MMKKISALACALLCLFAFSFSAFADFGDYGGDYDYGGYDYDYGNDYDYDYGNDYDYDYGYDYDDDDDYHYQTTTRYYSLAGYPGGSDGYGGGPDIFNALGKIVDAIVLSDNAIETASDDSANSMLGLLLVVVIAIIIIVAKRQKNGGGPDVFNKTYTPASSRTAAPRPAGATPTDAGKLQSLASYAAEDPGFSEADFREKLSNLYVKLQNAWTDKDLSVLRPYLSDGFYASSDRQLDNYRRNRQTNRIERIAVLDVNVRGWMRQGSEDIMVASLRTRITDYVTDDKTGNVVRGSRTQEKFMEYEWTLARKTGVKTENGKEIKVVNCPNCGAPLNINKTAKCPYCDSIITVDSHDWVLTGIKGISQRTMGK